MLALRRKRMATTHPFLRGGFRPFFFGGTLWGLAALLLWLSALAGAIALPTHFDALAWHRHEMIFGFVGAVIAGFLLTAIPNWTGRLPIAGRPLLALVGLWLLARLALLGSAVVGGLLPAILDVGFFATLAGLALREIVAAGNRRNLAVVGMVVLLSLANAADHAAANGLLGMPDIGWRSAIAIIVMLISLIGGRITPSFTRNWMVKRGIADRLPTQPQTFDLLVIACTALALAFWLAFPDQPLTGLMLILAAAAQGLRLMRWGGLRILPEPLVFVLHVGYAWVPIGLLLLGLGVAGWPVARSAGIHALTAGAMATMILAVMTRASLGHTGHALNASPATMLIYALVTVGALLRVIASLGVGALMYLSGGAWGAALLLFLIAYAPILSRPRLGEAA